MEKRRYTTDELRVMFSDPHFAEDEYAKIKESKAYFYNTYIRREEDKEMTDEDIDEIQERRNRFIKKNEKGIYSTPLTPEECFERPKTGNPIIIGSSSDMGYAINESILGKTCTNGFIPHKDHWNQEPVIVPYGNPDDGFSQKDLENVVDVLSNRRPEFEITAQEKDLFNTVGRKLWFDHNKKIPRGNNMMPKKKRNKKKKR